jgi:hypothetical protein
MRVTALQTQNIYTTCSSVFILYAAMRNEVAFSNGLGLCFPTVDNPIDFGKPEGAPKSQQTVAQLATILNFSRHASPS